MLFSSKGFRCVVVLMLVFAGTGWQWDDEFNDNNGERLPFLVELSALNTIYVGEMLHLEVVLRNAGPFSLRIPTTFGVDGDLELRIDYPPNYYGGRKPGGRGGTSEYFTQGEDRTVVLEPGAFFGKVVRVGPFPEAGRIRIRATIFVPESDKFRRMKKGWAESNSVVVEIQERPEHN